jgi:enoyl-CoA hydratase/carnithine racemase
MWEAMPRILERFEADPAVRTIVLRGAGDAAFVSGADISQFEKARANPEMNAEYDAALDRATEALEACTKPTIAMIRGWCIGGGMAIAVCCDMRIATEGSKFGVPAARLGLGYGAVGVRRLMNIVGPSFTKEIFLTARHFSAAEALAMGLLNRAVPDAELDAYVRGYCATIGENAPMTMKTLKRTVAELLRGHEGDLDLCARMVDECFASQDFVEGRRAFMEKRRPVFRGA